MSSALSDADQDAGLRFGVCTHCGRPMTEEEQHYYGTACDRCESEMHFAMQDDRDPVLPPPETEEDRLRAENATLRARATAAEDKPKDREAEIERLKLDRRRVDNRIRAQRAALRQFEARVSNVIASPARLWLWDFARKKAADCRSLRAALASTEHHASSEEASR